MQFKKLEDVASAYPLYCDLYSRVKTKFESFNGFDLFNKKLFKGDFLLLKNRFHLTVYAGLRGATPKILITHYQAKDVSLGEPHSLGAVLVDADVSVEELLFFQQELQKELRHIRAPILAPLNGHMHLGVSIPASGVDPRKITFLTSASTPKLTQFFENTAFQQERRFYSYTFPIQSIENETKALAEYASTKPRPKELSVRCLSLLNFKRDVKIYHDLLSKCFTEHYRYYPLSFEEEWDLMKMMLPLIRRDYFRFLYHGDKPIAVSWFMPDYNQGFKNGHDFRNILSLQSIKKKPKRVRGVYGAILPEYRGKKQMKWLRNENYLQILKDGVQEIESSYVDEGNQNSQAYIQSTGAQYSHEFGLYRLCTRVQITT